MLFLTDGARHLVCLPYSVANLHVMAERLNIKRCWFHASGGKAHYDIPKKRIKEIEAECLRITPRQLLQIVKGELTSLPEPELRT